VAIVAAGCATGDGLAEREVRLQLPDQRTALEIDGCARDGDVVVLGASRSNVLLQVLLELGDDDEVDLEASGITVSVGTRGTLGAGDPELIDSDTGDAGTIEEASVRGDRIDVVADAERTSRAGDVEPGRIEVSARCTPEDDLAAR
jgi:hypothetical protein